MTGGAGEAAAGGLFYLRDWKLLPTDRLGALSVAEVRAIDRIAVERFGVPSLLLMERAALGLEVVALDMLAGQRGTVVILCGPGSNGGDGFALGRLLLDRGISVEARIAPGAGASGDAAVNREMFERFGGVVASGFRPMGASEGDGLGEDPSAVPSPGRTMPPAPLIVDALFGTGLSRAIEGPAAELVAWANGARAAGSRVLAVDIPSGMDGETGEPLGPAIEADTTVTLVAAKPGLLTAAGRARCGRIVVAPIGVEGAIAASG